MENLIKQIIKDLGENPKREGLLKTPTRYAAALRHLTSGYKINAEEVIKKAIFNENYNEMVIVKDIEFYSLCEHHMLPFFGKAHIAYTPKGKIVGLSKIPRIVNIFSRRLQVQERLTQDVSNCLMKTLKPHGVGVVIEAYHMCMMMRGVEKQRSSTLTSSMLGTFREDARTRKEFLNLVSKPFSI